MHGCEHAHHVEPDAPPAPTRADGMERQQESFMSEALTPQGAPPAPLDQGNGTGSASPREERLPGRTRRRGTRPMTAKLRRWIDAGRPLTPNDLTPPNVRLSERRALLDAARAGELEALAVLRSLHLRQWQSGGRWIIPEGMPPLPPEQGHRAKLAYASRSEIPRSGNGHYLRSGRLTRPRVFRAPVSPIRRDGANDCTGRNHREEEAGGRVELPHEEQPITT